MSDISSDPSSAPPPRFDPEAFAKNISKAMENSGAALASFLKGRENTAAPGEPPSELNQHKSDADHVAVATALGLQTSPGAQAIARDMKAMRPHAFAETAEPHDLSETGVSGLVEETM